MLNTGVHRTRDNIFEATPSLLGFSYSFYHLFKQNCFVHALDWAKAETAPRQTHTHIPKAKVCRLEHIYTLLCVSIQPIN